MGLQPDDLTSAEREAMRIEGEVGILLSEVYAGGPADLAGLTPGDVILEINGEPIVSGHQARLLVAGMNPGDELRLLGVRDGAEFRVTVVAAERPVSPD